MSKLRSFINPNINKSDAQRNSVRSIHPFIMMVILLLFFFVLSYIVPAGQYERIMTEEGTALIDPDSFMYIQRTPVSVAQLLLSVTLGLQRGSSIIFFLLIIFPF